ncbi:MAG: hypothetical protein J6K16_03280 [Alphaproteobacteria bacterium]|nr:hypothetical protein [Alphaproteobacteria bacterium]
MIKNFQNYKFVKKGKICANRVAYRHLVAANEPELARFFSSENQRKIVDLLREADNAMRRYREVKAHDYVIEDFSDECAHRLPMASECVARPDEFKLKAELQKLFPSEQVYDAWSKHDNPVWKETLDYWVWYVNVYWVRIFDHSVLIVADCYTN